MWKKSGKLKKGYKEWEGKGMRGKGEEGGRAVRNGVKKGQDGGHSREKLGRTGR